MGVMGVQREDDWLPVWSALSDESLEQRLRHYLWIEKSAPRISLGRADQLKAEAERRGKPEIIERAVQWLASQRANA